ncbi:MAG: hypothetical protein NW703_02810 [Nitrospiraceae bacterium]
MTSSLSLPMGTLCLTILMLGLLWNHADARSPQEIADRQPGGIEPDEIKLFVEMPASVRVVLAPEQSPTVRELSRQTMLCRVSQGFSTKIGLMSLDGIGRVYISVRRNLLLSASQVRKIQSLFEAARRNLLRLGREIDLGRGEADRLVMRPDMDPQVIRAQGQKTGKTEGRWFSRHLDVSEKIADQATQEQRGNLVALKK